MSAHGCIGSPCWICFPHLQPPPAPDPRDAEIAFLREALATALETPADVNTCTDLEYELRGPETLLVFADSGEIPSSMVPQIRIHAARWAQAIKDRARLQEEISKFNPSGGYP